MKLKNIAMIIEDKVFRIAQGNFRNFCIIDEFCKFFEQENGKKLLLGKRWEETPHEKSLTVRQ